MRLSANVSDEITLLDGSISFKSTLFPIPQVIVALFALITLSSASVIRDSRTQQKFSPYFAAFSDQMWREVAEYERIKRQLVAIKPMDWNTIAPVKAFESKESSS